MREQHVYNWMRQPSDMPLFYFGSPWFYRNEKFHPLSNPPLVPTVSTDCNTVCTVIHHTVQQHAHHVFEKNIVIFSFYSMISSVFCSSLKILLLLRGTAPPDLSIEKKKND